MQYFLKEHQCELVHLPYLRFGQATRQSVRYFTDKLPIGQDLADRGILSQGNPILRM